MGLHPSKDASQDFERGSLIPTGIYASSIHDYDYPTVRNLILQRRMAPFYRGQQDLNPVYSNDSTEVGHSIGSKAQVKPGAHQSLILLHPKISLWSKYRPHRKESLSQPPPLYKDAVECPICFLYYPPNINYASCCHQPICTECFVHIRAPDSGLTAASCPFCVEPNFGIEYHAPLSLDGEKDEHGLEDHSIVTIDRIRPQHTRILSSRHHRDAASSSAIGSTRRIIVRPNGTDPEHFTSAGRDYRDYLTAVRQMNMDLEELMVMEAIRLSLIEQSTESSQSTSDSTTPNTNRSIQDHPLEL
ncbi:SNF1-interacting protein [Umbelopsis sp. WA50703]